MYPMAVGSNVACNEIVRITDIFEIEKKVYHSHIIFWIEWVRQTGNSKIILTSILPW